MRDVYELLANRVPPSKMTPAERRVAWAILRRRIRRPQNEPPPDEIKSQSHPPPQS